MPAFVWLPAWPGGCSTSLPIPLPLQQPHRRLLAQPGLRAQLSDDVVARVGAGLARLRDHLGATIADGIHAGVYRPVGAADVADLLWALLAGNLDTAELRGNLELPAPLAIDAARRQATLVEASLRAAPVAAAMSRAA